MQVQLQIDETVYAVVSKKADLLKSLNDYDKKKFNLLEERIRNGTGVNADRKAYTLPNLMVRELEVQRIKNNKSKRSDKNDMTSVASSKKTSTNKFGLSKKMGLNK
jgi:hypothetical protein